MDACMALQDRGGSPFDQKYHAMWSLLVEVHANELFEEDAALMMLSDIVCQWHG
jgi:hypothetical protein